MDTKNIELLLERIAISLEKLASHPTMLNLNAIPSTMAHVEAIRDENENENENEDKNKLLLDSLEPLEPLQFIISFLEKRNIKIKFIPLENDADPIINKIALFMGDHYRAIEGLYRKIKRTMQTGGLITESLAKETQIDVSTICQWCSNLHKIAFLEQYIYLKSPHFIIKAKTTTLPKAQNFFSGQWLERYVLEKIKSSVNQIKQNNPIDIAFSYLINPQIVLPNGNDFELDVICEINGIIYWIEAKTGDYQQHIRKYASMAKMMNLDDKHAIMLLTDISASASASLSALFSMTVCAIEQFEAHFISLLKLAIETPKNNP